MGNSFRPQPFPVFYGENKTPFASDLLEVGLLVAFGMIAASFVLIIPGIRGWERLWATIRVFVALWIGAVLLVSNFAYTWHTDKQCVRTQYKAYVFPVHAEQEIQAEVGLHIGLRGINVTLVERPFAECAGGSREEAEAYERDRPFPGETINYNEAFRWADPWFQGRFGFGRFASRLNQEFRAAQFTGDPYPILWIAEYFTLDGEQIRWFRKYRQAGWYAHIFLWIGFATYLLSMLLYIFVISTGAVFMFYTGLMMVCACASFGIIIINSPKLRVPFGDIEGHVVFVDPQFGWAWYLTLFTGLVTMGLAILIWILNYFMPRRIATVFHHSVVEEDEFFQVEDEEVGEKPSLEEYGVSTRGTRGATTRGRTTRRGLSKYRQTQRKPRSTVRSSKRGGSQRLNEDIQLAEVEASGEK